MHGTGSGNSGRRRHGPLYARYRGLCGKCGRTILPGEPIRAMSPAPRRDWEPKWRHANCAEAAQAAAERAAAPPPVPSPAHEPASPKQITGRLVVAALVIAGLVWAASSCHPGHRVGAVCNDGWISSATGSGACSHHGGVNHWIYE